MTKNVIYIVPMYFSEFCMYTNHWIFIVREVGGGGESLFVLRVFALLEIFEDGITLINRRTTVTLHLYSVLKILYRSYTNFVVCILKCLHTVGFLVVSPYIHFAVTRDSTCPLKMSIRTGKTSAHILLNSSYKWMSYIPHNTRNIKRKTTYVQQLLTCWHGYNREVDIHGNL